MARDRKRAKQRRERRGAAAARRGTAAGAPPAEPLVDDPKDAPTPTQPVRSDLPGALDHASAEVDEFDAALVRGAGGVAEAPETDESGVEDGLTAEDELPLQDGHGSGGGEGGGSGGGDRGGRGGDPDRPSGAPLRGGNRAVAFLGASWAELQRVQWPDRRQVTQATAVVIGFVAIAGAYLGVADYLAKEIVELVL